MSETDQNIVDGVPNEMSDLARRKCEEAVAELFEDECWGKFYWTANECTHWSDKYLGWSVIGRHGDSAVELHCMGSHTDIYECLWSAQFRVNATSFASVRGNISVEGALSCCLNELACGAAFAKSLGSDLPDVGPPLPRKGEHARYTYNELMRAAAWEYSVSQYASSAAYCRAASVVAALDSDADRRVRHWKWAETGESIALRAGDDKFGLGNEWLEMHLEKSASDAKGINAVHEGK